MGTQFFSKYNTTFYGSWVNNTRYGPGALVTGDSMYVGQWEQDQFQGFGWELGLTNGWEYKGTRAMPMHSCTRSRVLFHSYILLQTLEPLPRSATTRPLCRFL